MECVYDALLIVSFGGPEAADDVLPFLENVTRGRNIPRQRLLEVAEHYYHFGGRSPINDQNRALISSLQTLFDREGPHIPIYWGNRNWHPLLAATVQQMKQDGIRNAAAFITSAFGSYSGCRQYREDIGSALASAGADAPEIRPLKLFWDQPGFLDPMTENVRAALSELSSSSPALPPHVAFTAHSVPVSMASTSPYADQLESACRTVANRLHIEDWKLVYQSRSGSPAQPWLEPDIADHIREIHSRGQQNLVIAPIGFVSDHMEVLYDLDTEAAALCDELDIKMIRAATVGVHPKFVQMIRDSLATTVRYCPPDCCPRPERPAVRP